MVDFTGFYLVSLGYIPLCMIFDMIAKKIISKLKYIQGVLLKKSFLEKGYLMINNRRAFFWDNWYLLM